jgi:Spy/CpxP family protein refolding chaperone
MKLRLLAIPFALLLGALPLQFSSANDHPADSGKMMKSLGLSADQTTKMKSVMDAQKTALKPLWDKQKDLMKKLKGQVDAKAGDSDIQATLSEIKSTHETMRTQMEQFQDQKAAILTPTQQAQMLLKRTERMDSHHGKHSKDEHPDPMPNPAE